MVRGHPFRLTSWYMEQASDSLTCIISAVKTTRLAIPIGTRGATSQSIGRSQGHLDRLSSSSPVVVLGDWNDALTDPDPQNVFRPFEEDSTHYQFADLDIAQPENQQSWSFPSYPSHLDHILVNRPLIPVLNQDSTLVRTIRVDQASGPGTHDYFQTLSDHRPVGLSFRVESTSVRR